MDVLSRVVVFIKNCKKLTASEPSETKLPDPTQTKADVKPSDLTQIEIAKPSCTSHDFDSFRDESGRFKVEPNGCAVENSSHQISSRSKCTEPFPPNTFDLANRKFRSSKAVSTQGILPPNNTPLAGRSSLASAKKRNQVSTPEGGLTPSNESVSMLNSLTVCGSFCSTRLINPQGKPAPESNAWTLPKRTNCSIPPREKNPPEKIAPVVTKQVIGCVSNDPNMNFLRVSKIPCRANSTVLFNYFSRQKDFGFKTLPMLRSISYQTKSTVISKPKPDIPVESKPKVSLEPSAGNSKAESKTVSPRSSSSSSRKKEREPFTVYFKGRSRSHEENSSRKKKVRSLGQVSLNGNEGTSSVATGNGCLHRTCRCRQHSEEVLESSARSSRSDTPPKPKPWAFTLRSYDKSPSPVCSRKSTPEKPANHQSRKGANPRRALLTYGVQSQTEVKYKPPNLSYMSIQKRLANGDIMARSCLTNSTRQPTKSIRQNTSNHEPKLPYVGHTKTPESIRSDSIPRMIPANRKPPIYRKPRPQESCMREPSCSIPSKSNLGVTRQKSTINNKSNLLSSSLPRPETKSTPTGSFTLPRQSKKVKLRNGCDEYLLSTQRPTCSAKSFASQVKTHSTSFDEANDSIEIGKWKVKKQVHDLPKYDKVFECPPQMNPDETFSITATTRAKPESSLATGKQFDSKSNRETKTDPEKCQNDFESENLDKRIVNEKLDRFFATMNTPSLSVYAKGLKKILKTAESCEKLIDVLSFIDQSGFNLADVFTSLVSDKFPNAAAESENANKSDSILRISEIQNKRKAEISENVSKNSERNYFQEFFITAESCENCKMTFPRRRSEFEADEDVLLYFSCNSAVARKFLISSTNRDELISFVDEMETKDKSNLENLKSISSVELEVSQLTPIECTTQITSASLATLDSDFDIFGSSLVEFEAACPSHLAKELEGGSYKNDLHQLESGSAGKAYKSKRDRGYLSSAFRCIQPNPSFQSNFELCHPSKFRQKHASLVTPSRGEKEKESKMPNQDLAISCDPMDIGYTPYATNSLPLSGKHSKLSKSFQNMCVPIFRLRSSSKSGEPIKKSWQSQTIAQKSQSQKSFACFGRTPTYSPDSDQEESVGSDSSFKNKSYHRSSDKESFLGSIFASPRFRKKPLRKNSSFATSAFSEDRLISPREALPPRTLKSLSLKEKYAADQTFFNLDRSASEPQESHHERKINFNRYRRHHHTYRSGYPSSSMTLSTPPLAVFSSDEDISTSAYPLRHVFSEPNYETVSTGKQFIESITLNLGEGMPTRSLGVKTRSLGANGSDAVIGKSFGASTPGWKRKLQHRLSYTRPVIRKRSSTKSVTCERHKDPSCSCLTSSDLFIRMMSQPYLIKARDCMGGSHGNRFFFFSLPNIDGKNSERGGLVTSNLSLQNRISMVSPRHPLLSEDLSLSLTSSEASSNKTSSLMSRQLLYSKGSQNVYVEALWDFVTLDGEELTFYAGDIIQVVECPEKTWWWGKLGDKMGWFPSSHVVSLTPRESEMYEKIQLAASSRMPSPYHHHHHHHHRHHHQNSDHHNHDHQELEGRKFESSEHHELRCYADDQQQHHRHRHHHHDAGIISMASPSSSSSSYDLSRRSIIIREMIKAEKDYVKHLKDIVEGYLKKCEAQKGMFTSDQVTQIFSNIEDICNFSSGFLKELKGQIAVENSRIGRCFIKNRKGFDVYSEYCNNHSLASQVLLTLRKIKRYQDFFETCRREQNMIEIPLEGFLLTPVQKICKYPLQLKELLRFTVQHHDDYNDLKVAIEVMRNITFMINDRKRRTEEKQNLQRWQKSVVGWQGPDITDSSTELIHSGELIKVTGKGWHQHRICFLFDHQMVFCKKDLLWKNLLVYKGRISTGNMVLHEEAVDHSTSTQKHSFKLHDNISGKTSIWLCKSPEDLERWMESLRKERRKAEESTERPLEEA